MGLKSKLNKMKSFLFDEEDEEKEVKKAPKLSFKKGKKEAKVENTEDLSKTKEIEELYFEDVSEPVVTESSEIKSRTLKNEKEFEFPEFNDDDFMAVKSEPESILKPSNEEVKPILYQGSKWKEETKKFKPSPIISPVYGLLDEDGNRIKRDSSEKEKNKRNEETSLDVVRKKAYGAALDKELEDTMKQLNKKTIEEAEKDMKKEEKTLSRTKNKAKEVKVEKPTVVSEKDDDMILPNVNFKEIDVDKERTKNLKSDLKEEKETSKDIDDDDDDDTKEQDLFNLIDSMYQKEGEE